MIVGEGGWVIGSDEDDRYPAISEELHRDYHLEVVNWFRTGKLSNGQELPDYLFAFTPWLISAGYDRAGWFDNLRLGDRELTIRAIEAVPPFVRKSSWDR